MRPRILISAFILLLTSAGYTAAEERSVTLKVDGLTCSSCPYIVKQTLARVPGVSDVTVSFRKKTAVVTFDDSKTNTAALTAATTNQGFPSRVIE